MTVKCGGKVIRSTVNIGSPKPKGHKSNSTKNINIPSFFRTVTQPLKVVKALRNNYIHGLFLKIAIFLRILITSGVGSL